jgi:hypothetical protein
VVVHPLDGVLRRREPVFEREPDVNVPLLAPAGGGLQPLERHGAAAIQLAVRVGVSLVAPLEVV